MTVNDTLPNKICKICESKLESFENFKLVCVQTDQILKQKIDNHVQIKIEEDYIDYENVVPASDILNTTLEEDLCENVENDNVLNSNISLMDLYKNFKTNSTLGPFEMIKCSDIKQDSDENETVSRVKKFECNECGKILYNRFKLLKHKKLHSISKTNRNSEYRKSNKNRVKSNTFNSIDNNKVSEEINLESGKFECLKCRKLFLSQRFLMVHEMSHFMNNDQQNAESDNLNNSENTRKTQKVKKVDNLNQIGNTGESDCEMPPATMLWKCERCEKIFGAKRGLVQHYRRVHKVVVSIKKDNRVIEVCHYEKIKKELKCEVNTVSSENIENLTCSTCKKTFKNSHNFKEHIKYVHMTERTIPCQICGALFKTPSYVKKHIRNSHLGESAVQCNTCGKILKTSASYKVKKYIYIYYSHQFCISLIHFYLF